MNGMNHASAARMAVSKQTESLKFAPLWGAVLHLLSLPGSLKSFQGAIGALGRPLHESCYQVRHIIRGNHRDKCEASLSFYM